MLITLPPNVHFGQIQVLAVNLHVFERIIIHKISDNEFRLMLDSAIPVKPDIPVDTDPPIHRITIGTYNTYDKALNAFGSLITAFQNGELVWTP